MKSTLKSLASVLRRVFRSRTDLLLEVTALRQQLEVYQRQTPRPKMQRGDRLFWIWLCRHWAGWRSALVIIKPETVLRCTARDTDATGGTARGVGQVVRGSPESTSSSSAAYPATTPTGAPIGSP